MSSTPTKPSGSTPPIPVYWSDEDNWIVLIVFLPRYDAEDCERATESIGYMFAYAQMTDTRIVALVGDPAADAYELLFSFSTPDNKAEFLRLLQSNDVTACEDDEILVPHQSEIDAAQPIAHVLPADVMRQVTIVATMLLGEAKARDALLALATHDRASDYGSSLRSAADDLGRKLLADQRLLVERLGPAYAAFQQPVPKQTSPLSYEQATQVYLLIHRLFIADDSGGTMTADLAFEKLQKLPL